MKHLLSATILLLWLAFFLPKGYSQSKEHISRQEKHSFVYNLLDRDVEIYQVSRRGIPKVVPQDSLYIGKYPRCLIATPTGHTLYVAGDADSNDYHSGVIFEFTIKANGFLKPLGSVDAGCMPLPMMIDHNGSFLYCSSTTGATNQGLIYQYRIAADGTLLALKPPFISLGNSFPQTLWVHPSGKYLYTPTAGRPTYFRINRNGTLSRLPMPPIPMDVKELALGPSGRVVYLLQSGGIISAATIDQHTGLFSHLRSVVHVPPLAFGMAISPQQKVLQITDEHTTGHNNWIAGPIFEFHIMPNGDLKPSVPPTFSGLMAFKRLAPDPKGSFANVIRSP